MDRVTPEIDKLESVWNPAGLGNAVAGGLGVPGNYLRTPEGQKYAAAANVWAEAVLRIQTGAAATQPEIDRNVKTYFAQPGDLPETIAYKQQLRSQMRESLGEASSGRLGPGGTPEQIAPPAAAGTIPEAVLNNTAVQKWAREAEVSIEELWPNLSAATQQRILRGEE